MHFISGLPRSGSTLLAAILRQNPRFRAGMTSPVSGIFRAMEEATSGRQETSVFLAEGQRDAILHSVFDTFTPPDCVTFDTSRMWCARLPVLARLFPQAKVIACVREVSWIADSFERLYRKNGQKPSAIYGWDTGGTVWSRTSALAASSGVIGYSLDALREASASEEAGCMLLVDYETLCKSTRETVNGIYDLIREPYFKHNFMHVEYEAGEFDRALGAEGLHTVTGAVEWRPRKTILPPDLFARFSNDSFWRA
jgi:sulfotransferase